MIGFYVLISGNFVTTKYFVSIIFSSSDTKSLPITELANLTHRNNSYISNCNRYNQQVRQKPEFSVTIELKVDNMIKKYEVNKIIANAYSKKFPLSLLASIYRNMKQLLKTMAPITIENCLNLYVYLE